MGRHSAPDDGEQPAAAAVATVEHDSVGSADGVAGSRDAAASLPDPGDGPAGRHSRPSPVAAASPADPAPSPASVTPAGPAGGASPRGGPLTSRSRGARATAADVALVRRHADVRARCLAGLLLPFAVYAVVLVVVGRLDVFAIWVWAPIVLAGVLVGTFLDLGHKRYPGSQPPDPNGVETAD